MSEPVWNQFLTERDKQVFAAAGYATRLHPLTLNQPKPLLPVAGKPMTTYLDWMASCWTITVLGGPAVAVPCGFTQGGLPIGLQIVGRRGDDAGVLRLAHAFEQATGVGRIRPVMDPERAPRRPAG